MHARILKVRYETWAAGRVHGAVAAATAGHGLSDDMNNEPAGLVGQRTNCVRLANCQFIVACMHEDDIVLLDRALVQSDLLRGREPPPDSPTQMPKMCRWDWAGMGDALASWARVRFQGCGANQGGQAERTEQADAAVCGRVRHNHPW